MKLSPLKIMALIGGLAFSYFIKDLHILSIYFGGIQSVEIYPDTLLIFIVFIALNCSVLASIWFGFAAGLMADAANYFLDKDQSVVFLTGIHSLVYCLVAYTVSRLQDVFNRKSLLLTMIIVFVCVFFSRVNIWFIQALIVEANKNYSIIGASLYTSLFSSVYITILDGLYSSEASKRN